MSDFWEAVAAEKDIIMSAEPARSEARHSINVVLQLISALGGNEEDEEMVEDLLVWMVNHAFICGEITMELKHRGED